MGMNITSTAPAQTAARVQASQACQAKHDVAKLGSNGMGRLRLGLAMKSKPASSHQLANFLSTVAGLGSLTNALTKGFVILGR